MLVSSVTGKAVNEKTLDILSNNLANALTPGFKESKPVFEIVTEGAGSRGGQPLQGSLVSLAETYVNFAGAPLVQSSNTFDVGIEGSGFFVVSTKSGPMYTRNGQFRLDQDKRLITMAGDAVMGKGGQITIDGKDILIENDGSIFVDQKLVDTLKVVDFTSTKSLAAEGGTLFRKADPSAEEISPTQFTVRQGYYETSNVSIMREMIRLIQVVRAYESYVKIDQFDSDLQSRLAEVIRR